MTTINERIAKAKGWSHWPDPEGSDYDGDMPMFTTWPGDDYVSFYEADGEPTRYYNWSGSIADAWELIPDNCVVVLVRGVREQSDWECIIDGVSSEAPTAPEAIALAWLAVNENVDHV